jgi:hypothetical protein
MNVYQAIKMLLKWLVIADAIIGFSACGFAQDNDSGKAEYQSSCAACHGMNGKGDGPLSGELRTTPSNLTLLAKNNGGVFPAKVLYEIIDGRKTIRAHGSYEMPVWGNVFSREPKFAQTRILAIVDYLKIIQVK